MHSPRAAISELRQHGSAWIRLVRPAQPRVSNYGDELSRLIVERVIGKSVRWASIGAAEMVALGSVIDLYSSAAGTGKIWGSGIADPDRDYDLDLIRPAIVGVRGPLTRDRLGLPGDTPLGDPGLLASQFWRFGSRQHGLKVLVPHYTAFTNSSGRDAIKALRADGFTIAPPNLNPEEMMSLIARAQYVVSSGLHGIILAHAFGTPSTLISLKAQAAPLPVFKYRDFFSSIGVEPRLVDWRAILSNDGRSAVEQEGACERLDAAQPAVSSLISELELSAAALANHSVRTAT